MRNRTPANNTSNSIQKTLNDDIASKVTPSYRLFSLLRGMTCVTVFIYVVIRCFLLALTGDEWGLILDDVQKSLVHLLIQGHIDVQSTFLLVVLSKFVALFCSNPIFAIRLPSAMALLLYLWASWKITAHIRSPLLSFVGLFALCANAYMLDFFSIGRGYSLALAFQMLSIYYFLRALTATHSNGQYLIRWSMGAIWAASFSVLAVVAFLNFYFAMLGSCLLLAFLQVKHNNMSFWDITRQTLMNTQHLFYNAALLGIFYLPRILILNMNNCFHGGGANGFIQSTVFSLINVHFYMRPPTTDMLTLLSLLVWAISVLATVSLACRYKQRLTEPYSDAGIYISLMLVIMAAFHVLIFYTTGTLYPIMRAALCFFPLFILQLIYFTSIPHWGARIIGLIILTASILIGLNGINLHRTQTYNCSAQHPAVIDKINSIHMKINKPIVLGVTDRLKYILWWYAEHRLGLTPRPNPKNIHTGLMRRFDWLSIYTLHYGNYRLFSQDTTHILLDMEEMNTNDIPWKLLPIENYSIANINLYEAIPDENSIQSPHPPLSILGPM